MYHSDEDEQKIQEVINRLGRSEPWLRNFAESIGITYEELLEGTKAWVENDDIFGGDMSFMNLAVIPEFWEHYQDVTNTIVPIDKQVEDFFSCSC